MTQRSISVPKRMPTETEVSDAVATGLRRAIGACGGKGTLADRMDANVKTVDRALTGESVPGARKLFGALLADATALDELAALYGVVIRPATADAANDMHVAARMANAAGSFMEMLSDGIRNHSETLALADQFRPLIQAMAAVIEEADAIKRRAA